MNWPKPAPDRAILGVLALGILCFSSFPSEAQVRAIGSGLSGSVSTLRTAVRHHLRRHRRVRELRQESTPSERQKDDTGLVKEEIQKPSPDPPKPEKPTDASKPPEPMGPPPPPATWTAAEVEAGRMDCERRLSGSQIMFDRLDPIREGACGAPAPIRLKGFDSERAPQLLFDPAPTTSCKMAQALRRWFDGVVQPKAKAYMHATIVRMNTLSGYDCRSRYDDPSQRLSQHAHANALDIGEFITAKGERIAVADAWDAGDERAAFLRDIHDGACGIFGTTLGPDANDAHKNHFHLDMTERRRPLCDFTPEQVRAREQAQKQAAVSASAAKAPASPAQTLDTPVAPATEQQPKREAHVRRRHRSHKR
jgi:hypothetical protein